MKICMKLFSVKRWQASHRALNGEQLPPMRYAEEMDSTNEEARRWITQGGVSGAVVVADFQTAGRGRRGNRWTSRAGDGLLFSVLLENEGLEVQHLATAAAEAMAAVLEHEGVRVGWKWPNDLYLAGEKVAGVLVEVVGDWVIVGMGLNVGGVRASEVGVSLAEVSGRSFEREQLLAAFYGEFLRLASLCGGFFGQVMRRVRGRCMLSGKWVSIESAGERLEGRVVGLADDGALVLEVDALQRLIYEGQDVRVRD